MAYIVKEDETLERVSSVMMLHAFGNIRDTKQYEMALLEDIEYTSLFSLMRKQAGE